MQTTNCVLMVAPTEFASNPEASEDNFFADPISAFDKRAVLNEAAALKNLLTNADVKVIEIDPAALPDPPGAPDGCFPNNWLMFVDGRSFLCPMKAPSRRRERALMPQVIGRLNTEGRFVDANDIVDISHWEDEGYFLEGTGSLVLDRENRIAFAAVSERTNIIAAERLANLLAYRLIAFEAIDSQGRPIYHTNVLMSIGTNFAVLCPEAIAPPALTRIRTALSAHREIIEVSWKQVSQYCGNVLELAAGTNGAIVAMSKTAFDAFDDSQLDAFKRCGVEPVRADISTIERVAGGSVRCMLAEVFVRPNC